MLKPLRTERIRIVVMLAIYLSLSLILGYWLLTAAGVLFVYAFILLYESYLVSRWLRKGASISDYPNVRGLAESLVINIYQIRQRSKQRNKRLKSILDRFYSMAVGLPDAVVVLEEDSNIEWANERALELLGINHDKDKGQRIDNLIRTPEFRHYLQAEEFEQPLRISSPVGEGLVLNIRVVRFRDGAQLLLARDLTTIVKAEEMRRSFVSNVSHEMRTPLTVINGYAETLLSDDALSQEYKEPLSAIAAQSQRLQNIIDGLLELSRLQGGSFRLSNEPIPMASLVREIVSEVENSKHKSSCAINVDVSDNIIIQGSAILMQSVISNLVYNAIHHTFEGTVIDIYWGDSGNGTSELVVTDNGQGIEPEHLSRITDLLILAVCAKKVMSLAQGWVWPL